MQHTYTPEEAAHQKKTMKAFDWVALSLSSEVFKWVGWVAAIAALQVVKERTESQWLLLVIVPLYLLLAMRIQWFLKVKQPEEDHADGSMTARFTGGRAVLGLVVTAFAWWFVWGLSNAIARSDLLPPIERAQAQVAPQATPPGTPMVTQRSPEIGAIDQLQAQLPGSGKTLPKSLSGPGLTQQQASSQ